MGKMYRLNKMASLVWAITYGVAIEDKSSLCALMAILFAVFYLAERTNEKE
jgi:hypothetical protein